ncbi:MAG: glycosyltransferase [Candidatus Zixiibacteriota bacterium]
MRLCLLAPANSPHTHKWIKYFRDKGHQIHILSFQFEDIPGVHLHYLPAPLKVFYLYHIPKIRSLLKKIGPDILHAHYASSYGFVGATVGFHPLVISVWGSDVVEFPKRSPIHREVFKYNLDQADRITVTSKMLMDLTKEFVSPLKRVIRIPFGVDVDNFKPRLTSDKKSEITVGVVKRLDYKYGIEYLVKGFALVEKKFKNVRLLIAGDGPLRNKLKKLSFQLGCEKKIKFLGNIHHAQVPNLLKEMDIFVMPSVRESFGVAALEASASQLPVIASNVGGIPEIIINGKTGLLVPPRNPSAIAESIIHLIENPDLSLELGKSGREFVMKNYDWKENAKRMENLYEDLLR